MSTKTQIFITGATGYIGSAILECLLQHRTASTLEITALVRNSDKVTLFMLIGVKTIVGSYDDGPLLERQASESDVVFACADTHHVGACEAILRGLKKRHEATGTVPILIHTSGTGVLTDNAKGMYVYDTIWDDTNPDQLKTLPDTQQYRNVDLLVLAADKEASIVRKRRGMVGLGLNKWPDVHVNNIADLYIVVYDAILDGHAGHGRNGLYFGENGEYTFKDISTQVAQALVDVGVSSPNTQMPTLFDVADYVQPENKNLLYLGMNSRYKANRARVLGWKPKYTTEDMLKSIRGKVEWQLKRKADAQ